MKNKGLIFCYLLFQVNSICQENIEQLSTSLLSYQDLNQSVSVDYKNKIIRVGNHFKEDFEKIFDLSENLKSSSGLSFFNYLGCASQVDKYLYYSYASQYYQDEKFTSFLKQNQQSRLSQYFKLIQSLQKLMQYNYSLNQVEFYLDFTDKFSTLYLPQFMYLSDDNQSDTFKWEKQNIATNYLLLIYLFEMKVQNLDLSIAYDLIEKFNNLEISEELIEHMEQVLTFRIEKPGYGIRILNWIKSFTNKQYTVYTMEELITLCMTFNYQKRFTAQQLLYVLSQFTERNFKELLII